MNKFAILAVFLIMLFGCSDDKGEETTTTTTSYALLPPSKVRLEQICRSYAENDFVGYAECIHSCKDKPESYKTQMHYLLKQRFALLAKDTIKISGYRTEQVVLHDQYNEADVYLDISYSDGRQEEILLPMIYEEGNWWVK